MEKGGRLTDGVREREREREATGRERKTDK